MYVKSCQFKPKNFSRGKNVDQYRRCNVSSSAVKLVKLVINILYLYLRL